MLPANSIEGRAAPFLKRIESLFDDLESERGKYMSAAKGLREDIKSVYDEAKDKGVPVKALKGLVRYRELEKKQKAIGDGLDIDEASSFETLVEALGDFSSTELGQATIDLAKARDKKEGKKNGKATAAAGAAPDPEAVKRQTEAELAEPIDEIDKPFAERHRAQKDQDAGAFSQPVSQVRGQIGDEPASHTVV